MASYILLAVATLLILWLSRKLISLNRNVALAEASGIPYRVSRKRPPSRMSQHSDRIQHSMAFLATSGSQLIMPSLDPFTLSPRRGTGFGQSEYTHRGYNFANTKQDSSMSTAVGFMPRNYEGSWEKSI